MNGFYEFFAGGGMVRAGLGEDWSCLLANDFDAKKGAAYAANWGDKELRIDDVAKLRTSDLPGRAALAWASFPCQDLSLAGNGAGLKGERSGTFWAFWRLIRSLHEEGREPTVVALENVCGALSSHGGADFAAIGSALAEAGYRFGGLVIDAARFVPQSRPRLFVVAVRHGQSVPAELDMSHGIATGLFAPVPDWYPPTLRAAYERLSPEAKRSWLWWRLPEPAPRTSTLMDIIEAEPRGVGWHTPAETRRLLAMMTPVNREKVSRAAKLGRLAVGGVYKRTRNGVQRAEVRFDDIAGCLRTPAGGSSRQSLLIVNGPEVRSRLLSPREAARLMGLRDTYVLPGNYNDAYHLVGDGVVVPVVRHLAAHIFEPLLAVREDQSQRTSRRQRNKAA